MTATLAELIAAAMLAGRARAALQGRIRREIKAGRRVAKSDVVIWLRARFPELCEADVVAIVAEEFGWKEPWRRQRRRRA